MTPVFTALLAVFISFVGNANAAPNSVSSSVVSTTTATSSAPVATSTTDLNVAAHAAGKLYFGTATDNPELNDTTYVHILSQNKMFGQLTPGNTMKWMYTEPERGNFTFAGGEQIVALAQSNGQIIRGHNCVWYEELPPWVTADNFDAPTLAEVVATHCYTIVDHWRGQLYAWDVINEPFADNGSFRSDVFYNTLNTTYIPIALHAARAADPFVKLYINEYNIEYAGPKSTALMNLVSELKADGVPLDGIGFQCHFILGEVPTDFQTILEQFVALGVEVAITELDIRMLTLPPTTAQLEQQKSDYEFVIAACKAVPKCIGATVWDWTDKYSWIPSTFPGEGAALPWDANFVRKPAYDGIVAGFQS